MTNDGVSPLSQVVGGGQLSEDCDTVLEEWSRVSNVCEAVLSIRMLIFEGCSGGGVSQSIGVEGAGVGGATGSLSTSVVRSFSDCVASLSDWLLVEIVVLTTGWVCSGGPLPTVLVSGNGEGEVRDGELLVWGCGRGGSQSMGVVRGDGVWVVSVIVTDSLSC